MSPGAHAAAGGQVSGMPPNANADAAADSERSADTTSWLWVVNRSMEAVFPDDPAHSWPGRLVCNTAVGGHDHHHQRLTPLVKCGQRLSVDVAPLAS